MHMTARIRHGWKMMLSLAVLLVAFIVHLVNVSDNEIKIFNKSDSICPCLLILYAIFKVRD